MKNINYYGQKISVSDEVAEFLEQDRLRETAQRRSDQRHINYVGVDIASVPDLFTDDPSDPTFEQAFRNLRKQDLRDAYPTLSDDDRKLLCLYYYHEYSMEEIGAMMGVTKMAISKRLRKKLDHLRSLMEHEAPQNFFLRIWFTNLSLVSYKLKPKKSLGGYHLRTSKYKNFEDLPLMLSAPEVGEVLGISRAAAYELVRSRGFPYIRIGTRILVPKDRFLAWIDAQTEVED